jgi:hypothetical protein
MGNEHACGDYEFVERRKECKQRQKENILRR